MNDVLIRNVERLGLKNEGEGEGSEETKKDAEEIAVATTVYI
jgi:hypothetical protein